jgi:GNAT superfamily N-acetyltransferase
MQDDMNDSPATQRDFRGEGSSSPAFLTVRRANATDAAGLHELAAATFPLACPPGAPAEAIEAFIAEHLSRARFADYLADATRDVLMATVDGAAAGYTMLVTAEPTDADVAGSLTVRPTTELSKFYVLAGHHGSGLSAALMAATLDAARLRGSAGVWLGVNNENARANRFYEKHGFVTVGTKHFQLGDRLENDFVKEHVFDAVSTSSATAV